jgi:hypothetical protein
LKLFVPLISLIQNNSKLIVINLLESTAPGFYIDQCELAQNTKEKCFKNLGQNFPCYSQRDANLSQNIYFLKIVKILLGPNWDMKPGKISFELC